MKKVLFVYGIYLGLFLLIIDLFFIASRMFYPLVVLLLIFCSCTFFFTFSFRNKIMLHPWIYLSFFLFQWFAMMWCVIGFICLIE